MSDLYTRLKRIQEHRKRGDTQGRGDTTPSRHGGDDPRADYLSPGPHWNEEAPGVFVRRRRYSSGVSGTTHSDPFLSTAQSPATTLSPLLRVGESGRLLAIDIETTGLSGGAGNVAFLVGVGELDPIDPDSAPTDGATTDSARRGAFRLTQLFLGDFDAEPAFLDALETLLSGAADATRADAPPRVYLTYNGSRFDLPVMRSRFLLNRRRFPEALHLDLLHLTRRLYGRAIGSCSLGNVEERVLGVRRDLDVPSAEVPERYLEYLRLRRTEQLDAVFAHHEADVVNLLWLTERINGELLRIGGEGAATGYDAAGGVLPPDPIAMARLVLERDPDPASARSILLRIRERTEIRRKEWAATATGAPARRLGSGVPRGWVESRVLLSAIARREGDLDLMRQVLEELLRERGTLDDAEELAKFWEHRRRDPGRALRILTDFRDQTGRWSPSAEYRAARLRRKLGVPGSG